ncbi:unnamed protein product [Phytophthora fragariaefolia]|uniref:Unnamed protein product n=1 Tax=Phytophthora fragariaefolia TaxID=1490495 RepID=A0A9W6X839_9STRA|nr:unnamed protein product [Phytophthora fragariaefolia]
MSASASFIALTSKQMSGISGRSICSPSSSTTVGTTSIASAGDASRDTPDKTPLEAIDADGESCCFH